MDELLKQLSGSYEAPVWLLTAAFAIRLLNLDKAVAVVWAEVIKPAFDHRREHASHVVRGVLLEEILYSRYMQVARHLVNEAWAVLMELRDGRIAADAVSQQLRTHNRDVMGNARQALGAYRCPDGRRLSAHLEALSDERITEFYAPIVADIAQYANEEAYWRGYERVRTTVLRESDRLLSEAVDEFVGRKADTPH